MAKQKTVFCCTDCGNETPNWAGRCPKCGSWNTLKEVTLDVQPKGSRTRVAAVRQENKAPKRISDLDASAEIRFSTGISEFDRVLGGGAVEGSLILVGGAPGIGKSTILLQMCGKVGENRKILYVTGEESERQLKLRANRLGVNSSSVYVLSETDVSSVMESIDRTNPEIVIIDSIQTISDYNSDSAPGSVSQVKECTMRLMRVAKEQGFTVFIVGHVNKEGSLAGPKVLEHMVDCVLYFEGEQNTSFRLLRAAKNRFGSTNEIGVFEMRDTGLSSVENPSEMLLSGRPENTPGTCVTCVMEGTRPLLAEIQALLTSGGYNASRRCNGLDYNRAAMLLAVVEKRGGLSVIGCDTYINCRMGSRYISRCCCRRNTAALSYCCSWYRSVWYVHRHYYPAFKKRKKRFVCRPHCSSSELYLQVFYTDNFRRFCGYSLRVDLLSSRCDYFSEKTRQGG